MRVTCTDGYRWIVEQEGAGVVLTRPGAVRHLSTTELSQFTPAHLDGLQPAEDGWWVRKNREDQ